MRQLLLGCCTILYSTYGTDRLNSAVHCDMQHSQQQTPEAYIHACAGQGVKQRGHCSESPRGLTLYVLV